jgi:hypothetical protein
MAWWPLGRSRRETAGVDAPATPPTAVPVVRPAASDGAWRDLPGLQRALAEPLRPVAISNDFRASLATHTDPSFVAPLSHRVDPSAGGLVDGLVSAGQPQPHRSFGELPVLPRPTSASAPRVQRRVEWSGAVNLPTVSWELPGLAAADPSDPNPPAAAPIDPVASDLLVAGPEADSGADPVASPAGTLGAAQTWPSSPPVSAEDSRVGVVRPPSADLPVTPTAISAPVVSRSVDPAAGSAPLSGFAAAISNLNGAGPTSHDVEEPGKDPVATAPRLGAAVQRWPDVGGAGERPSVGGVSELRWDASGGTENRPAVPSVSRDQTAGATIRPSQLAPSNGVQAGAAGLGDRDLPTTGLSVSRAAADPAPQRPLEAIQTLTADAPPAPGPRARFTSDPLAQRSVGPAALSRDIPPVSGRVTHSATVSTLARSTPASLPVVSRAVGEVGVPVDPTRPPRSPTFADRSTDVPTLRPRLERTPMALQRTSLTGSPSAQPEPPVQRIEFLPPLGAQTPARSSAPATGTRPTVEAPAIVEPSQPSRHDSESTPRFTAPAASAPEARVLALARPAVQRRAAAAAGHDADPSLVAAEPTVLREPAESTAPVSGWDAGETDVPPMLSESSGPAVATESWRPESSPVESPQPESSRPVWSPLETAPVAGGGLAASYSHRVGQPSPAVAVGPAMPVQRSTHPMESPSSTRSSSPLVVSRQAASPEPSQVGRSSGAASFAAMFGAAQVTQSGETGSAATDGFTSVQLAPADDAPAPSAPPSESPAAPSASSAAPPAPAGAAPTDLDEMARRLYEPLSARLRAELWLDRERAGVMSDV